ncbi:hypothetical protein AVME950_00590 [Acidovorax sp. SUPP950]|uniref:hypothetical protein n=1 Tax=Acidovorax sp. SUPP950 TaxID=511901 RepID=UPI0023C50D5A|nr:hypothetical protein [Acidovorax sp. SUPP950]GKS73336.1 hypothetical protein AVME950_00590 [Acidovorax sp. SUPP950]
MTVEYFLIDAPHTVPDEYAAWVQAKNRHHALFLEFITKCKGRTDADALAMETLALAAAAEAQRLEIVARQAWAKKFHIQRDSI